MTLMEHAHAIKSGLVNTAEEDLDAATYIELARAAAAILDRLGESGDAQEWFVELGISPVAMAHLLMTNMHEPTAVDGFDKRYWFDIAMEFGPDYAQDLYHAAVFTTKVA